jgi:hypothetical protein
MAVAKSVLAVVAGIVTFSIALLVMMAAGNALLGAEPEWINRSTATRAAWLAWNAVAMIGGGYVAAWIAPRAKVSHAVMMGLVQALVTLGAFLTATRDSTPAWLWMGGIAAVVPAAWLGARLRMTFSQRAASASARRAGY